MTPRQHDVLVFIREFIEREGWAPSIREIAAGVGLSSPSTVQLHLANLERAGLIVRGKAAPPGNARMIRLTEEEPCPTPS